MVGQDKRLSPLMSVGNNKHNADKERAHALVAVVNQESGKEVEEELEEGEFVHDEDLGAVVEKGLAALVPELPTHIDVRVDLTLLHCQDCFQPLKPSVFKVDA